MKKIYILLTVTLLVAGCSKHTTTAEPKQSINVNTTETRDTTYIPVLEYTGTLTANKEANLGSIVPGRVERILIPEGGYVAEGALIVEMADELMVQTKIEYQTLEKDMHRMDALLAKNTVSRQEYDHVQAKYEAAKAKYSMLKKNTEIRAPFSGTVVKHCVKQGENYNFLPNISPGYSMNSGIVSLMQLNPLLVKVDVNEQHLQRIKLGQSVDISLTMLNINTHGKVTKIMPILSQTTRTATVEISIANPGNLKPGMFCKASFKLPAVNAVAIPRECLIRTPGTAETYVFSISESVATKKAVNVLGETPSAYIVSGIDKTEALVTDGKGKLSTGTKVKVMG